MQKRKWPIVLGVLAVGLFAVHKWTLVQISKTVTAELREESGYPARIRKAGGFLPAGKLHAQGVEFKTRFGPLDSIDWNIPDLFLDLRIVPLFSKIFAVQAIEAEGLQWTFHAHTMGGTLAGDLSVEGSSSIMPPDLPPDTIWCEHVRFSTLAPTGIINDREIELPVHTRLEVSPFSFLNGEPVLPFDFAFQTGLSRTASGPFIKGKGHQNQKEKTFEIRLGAYGLEPVYFERFLTTAVAFDPGVVGIRNAAAEWILDGSYTALVQVKAAQDSVSGELTLRLHHPRFGESLKKEQISPGQSIRPILESLESREDTIDLGPLAFKEDLTTDDQFEAWEQLQIALLAELATEAPEAAYETGIGLLRNWLKGR